MFRGVPGFLEVAPGYSGFSEKCPGVFRVFWHCSVVFRDVPWYSCVPVSRVPVFVELLLPKLCPSGYASTHTAVIKKRNVPLNRMEECYKVWLGALQKGNCIADLPIALVLTTRRWCLHKLVDNTLLLS